MVFAMNKFYYYHLNLIRLAQIYLTSYYLDIISRFITLSCEIGLIKMTGSLPEDLLVLLANYGRIAFTAQYCCMIPAMLSERAFATYFLEDYESKKRRWISVLVYGISFSYSAFGAYKITSGSVELFNGVDHGLYRSDPKMTGIEWTSASLEIRTQLNYGQLCLVKNTVGDLSFVHIVVIFLIIGVGILSFVLFYRYNNRKLADLSGHYRSTNRYTLTVRYQVTENLKVLKNILIMSVIMSIFLLVAGILVYIMFYTLEFFSFPWQITTAILEMWIAFSANAITVSLFILNKKWSNTTMRQMFCIRENAQVTTMTIDKPQQTDVYFSYLAKQW